VRSIVDTTRNVRYEESAPRNVAHSDQTDGRRRVVVPDIRLVGETRCRLFDAPTLEPQSTFPPAHGAGQPCVAEVPRSPCTTRSAAPPPAGHPPPLPTHLPPGHRRRRRPVLRTSRTWPLSSRPYPNECPGTTPSQARPGIGECVPSPDDGCSGAGRSVPRAARLDLPSPLWKADRAVNSVVQPSIYIVGRRSAQTRQHISGERRVISY
jgi:hypothetical protein